MHQRFQTYTTRRHPHGQQLCALLAAATHAADPRYQITQALHSDATQVVIGTETFTSRSVVLLAIRAYATTQPGIPSPTNAACRRASRRANSWPRPVPIS